MGYPMVSQNVLPAPLGAGLLDSKETIKHPADFVDFLDFRRSKAVSLLDCFGRKKFRFFCMECGELHEKQLYCSSRLCATCRPLKARKQYASWAWRLQHKDINRLAMVTLTQTARNGMSLAQLYDRAYKASKKLTRQKIWTETIKGCLRVIEVKPSKWLGRWNVHLHILVDAINMRVYKTKAGRREAALHASPGQPARTLDKRRLSAAWRALTGGDSYIVDIVPCFKREDKPGSALGYVMKYVFKAQDFSADTDLAAGQILDYQRVMRGRRMVQALGAWHSASKSYNLQAPKVREVKCECGGKYRTSFQEDRQRRELMQALRFIDSRSAVASLLLVRHVSMPISDFMSLVDVLFCNKEVCYNMP